MKKVTILLSVLVVTGLLVMMLLGGCSDAANPTADPIAQLTGGNVLKAGTSNQTGTNNGYFYSFWSNGGGTVNYTNGAGGNYSVNWTNCGDFTCGKGWNPGSGHTITYSGSYSNSGGGACGIYGWTTNPLVEYYIADSYNGITSNSGTTQVGTLTSDGATYTIYKHQQVGQPSIEGNSSTFWQYISVRNGQRVGGTITIQNHFNAWKNAGLSLGTQNYQILLTESWNGSGNANITVSEGGSTVTATPTRTPTNGPTATPTSGSGNNTIVVRARGTSGQEQISLTVGGSTIANWTLSTSMSDYTARTNNSGGINVQFSNDGTNRDVQVDYVSVNGSVRQAEAQTNNTGVYQNNKCGGSNSEWLHCNGYIGFGDVSGGGTVTATPTANPTATPTSGTNGSVYLTFDDGPNNSNSQTLINTLKNNGVSKASMFVWGNRISGNSSGWSVYTSSGFSLQNHSWTHSHMTSWSYQQVYDDLNQCSQAIQNAGKPKPSRVRLPYLESNSTIQQACSALGLSIVQPSVDTQDWNGASSQSIINACNNLQNGGNPLMHDQYSTTIQALPTIIQNLKNRGLGFNQY